jgi:hypothetical protein
MFSLTRNLFLTLAAAVALAICNGEHPRQQCLRFGLWGNA